MSFGRLPVLNLDASDSNAREQGLFLIPADSLDEARGLFAKLAKRAAKRMGGADAPTIEPVARGTVTLREYGHDAEGHSVETGRYTVPGLYLQIMGGAVKIAGWQLAARLEPIVDSRDNLLMTVPGHNGPLPERFRHSGTDCEHCNTSRYRRNVFVLRHDNGEYRQVGRDCLRDFLGHDPARLLAQIAAFRTLADAFGRDSCNLRTPIVYGLRRVLAITSAAIRLDGWVSRAAAQAYNAKVGNAGADKHPTSLTVRSYLWERETRPERWRKYDPTEADEARAAEAIAWVRDQMQDRGDSDYAYNLKTACRAETCDGRMLGLVCSAIAAYMREQNRLAEIIKERESNVSSQHVGAVKERLKGIAAKVLFVKLMDSHYGAMTLVKFRDAGGNILTWFASGDVSDWYKVGRTFKLTRTVKKHAEYNGIKETQLSRCKAEIEPESTAAA